MEWWGWLTWAVTAAIAAGALILGIRAERRATRYAALWVRDIGHGALKFTNRTGEDATDVQVEITGGRPLSSTTFPRVAADSTVTVTLRGERPVAGGFVVNWRILWTRPRKGTRYYTSTGRGKRLRPSGSDNGLPSPGPDM